MLLNPIGKGRICKILSGQSNSDKQLLASPFLANVSPPFLKGRVFAGGTPSDFPLPKCLRSTNGQCTRLLSGRLRDRTPMEAPTFLYWPCPLSMWCITDNGSPNLPRNALVVSHRNLNPDCYGRRHDCTTYASVISTVR